jgi:hypothetical protein
MQSLRYVHFWRKLPGDMFSVCSKRFWFMECVCFDVSLLGKVWLMRSVFMCVCLMSPLHIHELQLVFCVRWIRRNVPKDWAHILLSVRMLSSVWHWVRVLYPHFVSELRAVACEMYPALLLFEGFISKCSHWLMGPADQTNAFKGLRRLLLRCSLDCEGDSGTVLQTDGSLCFVCAFRFHYWCSLKTSFPWVLFGPTEHSDRPEVCGSWQNTICHSPLTSVITLLRLDMYEGCWRFPLLACDLHGYNFVFVCLVYAVCFVCTLSNLP